MPRYPRSRFGAFDDDVPSFDAESDPDVLFGARRDARNDRKTLQLCRQVERTLALVLAGECDDDDVRAASVGDVTPAPDASRMLVKIIAPPHIEPDRLLARLQELSPFLRTRVASAIHRKRAPTLAFVIGIADEEVSDD